MAQISDLMGLGLPGPLASRLGSNVMALTTTGTSSGTAATINASLQRLDTAGSQTGAIFPTSMPLAKIFVLFNPGATSAVLYPMSGATINGASSLTLAQNKTVAVMRYSATVLVSVLTA